MQALVGAKSGRISTYVDDPIMPCVGDERQRSRTMVLAIISLAALYFPLSLKKVSRSKDQKWTSAMFRTLPDRSGLEVRIKDEMVQDIKDDQDVKEQHDSEEVAGIPGRTVVPRGVDNKLSLTVLG